VDEVLAVGDAEFQKKALGKMKDVSTNSGRTVLFVSHNIAAVQKLCDRGLLLKNGYVTYDGTIKNVIAKYISDNNSVNQAIYSNETILPDSDILEIKVLNDAGELCSSFKFNEQIHLSFSIKVAAKHLNATFGFRVKDQFERNIFSSEIKLEDYITADGKFEFRVEIPKSLLVPNNYQIQVALHLVNQQIIRLFETPVSFEIVESGSKFIDYAGSDYGCILVDCKWEIKNTRELISF